jgi:hypothetical protein
MNHVVKGYSISNAEYSQRWDAIFGRDLDEKHPPEEPAAPEAAPVKNVTDTTYTDK